MKHIALIGAGKLGSRHLQALGNLNIDAVVYVIDPNAEALNLAEQRLSEVSPDLKKITVFFLKSSNEINVQHLDIAIIATTSEYRREVIEKLIGIFNIDYFILEKILFQKIEDYTYIKNLLEQKNIKAWVNCPRRVWDIYSELKSNLNGIRIREFNVTGQNWSLATSSMHFIDLIAYLSEINQYEILNIDFNNEIFPAYSSVTGSRESKFVEFYGSLKGKFLQSSYFNFTCFRDSAAPFLISIYTDTKIINIYEEQGRMDIIQKDFDDKWSLVEKTFVVPYQSQLTNVIVKQIIEEGNCLLTRFEDSVLLHFPLINEFNKYIGGVKGESIITCPIT